MEVRYKGKLFTKILIDNQRSSSSSMSSYLKSGQIVRVSCNEDQDYSIYIHKALLVANSSLLRRLLQEDNSACPTIIIPDFDISTVEKFCRLLYQGYTLVNALEIENIRKLAEMLDFQKPTISDPSVEEVNCTTVLKYLKNPSGNGQSARRRFTSSASNASAITIVDHQDQTPTPPLLKTSRPSSSSARKHKSKKRRDKSGTSTSTCSTASLSDLNLENVPLVQRMLYSPTPSTSQQCANTRPALISSRSQRSCSTGTNHNFGAPVTTDDWDKFIKCYFCSSTFDNQQSLAAHLTQFCGKHLLGHLSFRTRYCDFCKSTADSLTQWGYVKHLNSCYQKNNVPTIKTIELPRSPSAAAAELSGNNPNNEFEQGQEHGNSNRSESHPRLPDSDAGSSSSASGNDSELSDCEVVINKQIRIMGALMTVQQFRRLRDQYRISATASAESGNTLHGPGPEPCTSQTAGSRHISTNSRLRRHILRRRPGPASQTNRVKLMHALKALVLKPTRPILPNVPLPLPINNAFLMSSRNQSSSDTAEIEISDIKIDLSIFEPDHDNSFPVPIISNVHSHAEPEPEPSTSNTEIRSRPTSTVLPITTTKSNTNTTAPSDYFRPSPIPSPNTDPVSMPRPSSSWTLNSFPELSITPITSTPDYAKPSTSASSSNFLTVEVVGQGQGQGSSMSVSVCSPVQIAGPSRPRPSSRTSVNSSVSPLLQDLLSAPVNPAPASQNQNLQHNFEQNVWDSILLEAVNKICAQHQRSDLSRIYNVVHIHMLSTTGRNQSLLKTLLGDAAGLSTTSSTSTSFKNSLTSVAGAAPAQNIRLQIQEVQRQLDSAVKRGLLLEIMKDGQVLCYLTNSLRQRSNLAISSAVAIGLKRCQVAQHVPVQNRTGARGRPRCNRFEITKTSAGWDEQVQRYAVPVCTGKPVPKLIPMPRKSVPPPATVLAPHPVAPTVIRSGSEYSQHGNGNRVNLAHVQGNVERFNSNFIGSRYEPGDGADSISSHVCVECGMSYKNPQLLMTHICDS